MYCETNYTGVSVSEQVIIDFYSPILLKYRKHNEHLWRNNNVLHISAVYFYIIPKNNFIFATIYVNT